MGGARAQEGWLGRCADGSSAAGCQSQGLQQHGAGNAGRVARSNTAVRQAGVHPHQQLLRQPTAWCGLLEEGVGPGGIQALSCWHGFAGLRSIRRDDGGQPLKRPIGRFSKARFRPRGHQRVFGGRWQMSSLAGGLTKNQTWVAMAKVSNQLKLVPQGCGNEAPSSWVEPLQMLWQMQQCGSATTLEVLASVLQKAVVWLFLYRQHVVSKRNKCGTWRPGLCCWVNGTMASSFGYLYSHWFHYQDQGVMCCCRDRIECVQCTGETNTPAETCKHVAAGSLLQGTCTANSRQPLHVPEQYNHGVYAPGSSSTTGARRPGLVGGCRWLCLVQNSFE